MKKTRINKRLVELGLADSRRKADEIILSGKLKINGEISTQPGVLVGEEDEINVDGKSALKRDDIYIAYNKPRGLVCSHNGQGANTIFDKLPKSFRSLKIAGRLDKESEGLMILSSNGRFIQEVSHPSASKTKLYKVETKQEISDEDIVRINEGVKLDDGISRMKAKRINKNSIMISMQEGKNRQIRRTLKYLDNDVTRLERVKIGDYANANLEKGSFVFIKPEDVL